MLSNLNKRFFNVFVFAFLCLLFPLSCFAESFISSEKVDYIYDKFAEIDCFKEYFKKNNIREELSFEAKDKSGSVRKGCLIPLYDCEELKQCYLDTYAEGYADPDHMRLYGMGKLKTKDEAIAFFCSRVKRMWSSPPKSLYFGVALLNDGYAAYPIVGNVAIGQLVGNDGCDCEVACALVPESSSKGIGTAVGYCLMRFMKNIVPRVKEYSSLKFVGATAKVNNDRSNKILERLGFLFDGMRYNQRYGVNENCYTYHL